MSSLRPFASLVLLLACFACHSGVGMYSSLPLGHEAQREETRALELDRGGALHLDTSYGYLHVEAREGSQGRLRATLRANGRTRDEARAVLERYRLQVEQRSDGAHVQIVGEPLRIQEGGQTLELAAWADYEAEVPFYTALNARTGSGDIRTKGALGACQLETSYGQIVAGEIRGGVSARSGSGSISVSSASEGAVSLSSDYGDVRLGEVRAEQVECRSGSGDIELRRAEAARIELVTSYGAVEVGSARGALRASSGSGALRLEDLEGSVEAESSYGSIEVEGTLWGLRAHSGSGRVLVTAREGSRATGEWSLTSNYGSLELRVPTGFACELDARTSYGAVECDFPVTIEAGTRLGEGVVQGVIGKGGAKLRLQTSSGAIALRKL